MGLKARHNYEKGEKGKGSRTCTYVGRYPEKRLYEIISRREVLKKKAELGRCANKVLRPVGRKRR